MPPGPSRHRVTIVVALVGVAASAWTWHVASQLAADSGFSTMLCRPGTALDCGTVLTSRWGRLLEVSVAVWGMVAFAAGALLALPGALGRGRGGLADLALLALASGSLGFALVLLGIAVFALRTMCLFCLVMDAVVVAWVVTVAPLAGRFAPAAGRWSARRRTAQAALAGGFLVAIAAGTAWTLHAGTGEAGTRAEVCAASPAFCAYWDGLPALPTAGILGDVRHTKGDEKAPITIAEFSDFQCPACAAASLRLRELTASRRDVRIVFRHFPLDSRCNPALPASVHREACAAAAAAECAAQQERFWEYHDLLFDEQRSLDRESYFRFARELGLDIPRFRACLDDPATRALISADVAAGAALGIKSTPTLFINGRRLEGALESPYWEFALVLAGGGPRGGS